MGLTYQPKATPWEKDNSGTIALQGPKIGKDIFNSKILVNHIILKIKENYEGRKNY